MQAGIVVVATGDARATASFLEELRRTVPFRTPIALCASDDIHGSAPMRRLKWVVALPEVDQPVDALAAGAWALEVDVVVVVTDDLLLDRRWLEGLLAPLSDPAVAATGPMTNAGRWPQCPADAPSPGDRTAVVRAYSRARGGAAPVERLIGLCPKVIAVRAGSVPRHREPIEGVVVPGVYVHCTTGPLVSACLITRDEAGRIAACITSLEGIADEVVVHDTGSVDGTIEIARALGATVIEGTWADDFAAARNVALAAARGEWVISIDADEVLEAEPEKVAEFRTALTNGVTFDIATLPLRNVTGSAAAPVRSTSTAQVPRLFRRAACQWEGRLHEQPVARSGQQVVSVNLDAPLLVHSGYLNQAAGDRSKAERNVRIASEALAGAADPWRARFDLGRSLAQGRQWDAAIRRFGEIAEECDDSRWQRAATSQLAAALIEAGRHIQAERVVDGLAATGGSDGLVRLLRARLAMAGGTVSAAIEAAALLDGLTPEIVDDHWSAAAADELLLFLAEARLRAGDRPAAATATLDALRLQPLSPLGWRLIGRLAVDMPGVAARAVSLVPVDDYVVLGARAQEMADSVIDAIAEAMWATPEGRAAAVALVVDVAADLPILRAMSWSVRVRQMIGPDRCPLLARAADFARPARERVLAAAIAADAYGDDDSTRALVERAARALTDAEVGPTLTDVFATAPQVADSVVVAAATSPARCETLAATLRGAGFDREADALVAHAEALAGAA